MGDRFFGTAQDRLVKGMRLAKVRTLEQAQQYLDQQYLPWWNRTLTVKPASSEDAHRPLEQRHDLAAVLSHVEQRQVKGNYTIQANGKIYLIDRADICPGLRGATVRVEQRRDGTLAIRFQDKYLRFQECPRTEPVAKPKAAPRSGAGPNAGGKSQWMKRFYEHPGPSIEEAIAISNATS